MRLVVHEFMTLDGVVQGPGSPDEDTTGGFTRGGWGVPYFDDGVGEVVDSWFARTEALLFGRTTYELMAAYWPQVDDPDDTTARVLDTAPKHVVSSTLTEVGWTNARLVEGDPLDGIRRLKESPGGELQMHGCATLARTLHEQGLLDEYRLVTFPITVGGGKRLFSTDAPASGYRCLESRALPNGTTYVALEPEPFDPGTFGIEDGRVVAD
ncbi:dihydrofolate reductase family protein [Herbiconiux sp. SYSU D00978]|uniref:dihydrofolate reductase family protein n=1 Tax=Herbiconiux sp. SYSU D00978 TaxID=2812562 RepID=UPI001A967268|nr:dihydrofolate reductase family protein [Herbiconiux sp. SYSU D00978]